MLRGRRSKGDDEEGLVVVAGCGGDVRIDGTDKWHVWELYHMYPYKMYTRSIWQRWRALISWTTETYHYE